MKIFVTGASGFIGSHVCRELVANGHEVAALCRDVSPWRLQSISDSIEFIQGRLDDTDSWVRQLIAFAPEAVAHLAWFGVANFDRNHLSQIKNVSWTADVLDASHKAGARVFVGLGSQAEHGPQSAIIGPDDETTPSTLYGEAKLSAGRLARKIAELHGMRFVWMRVFSTYGPTDHPYWMIPNLIGDLLAGKRPGLTGGEQLWDFLHVSDAGRAVRLAFERDQASGVYALGSGVAPRLRDTIEMIRDAIDPDLPLGFGDIPYRPDQVMHLQADVAKLNRDMDWQPQRSLQEGLAETVAWYRDNHWIYRELRQP